MSTLKVTNIESPSGGGVSAKINDIGGGQLSNRNLIINGNMAIAQRGTSVTFNSSSSDAFAPDRFKLAGACTQLSGTLERAYDAATGVPDLPFSLKWTTNTAESSVDASDLLYLAQYIEGFNAQSPKFGASAAQQTTLSFWVKCSIAGTYGVSIYRANAVRNIVTTYTIDSADTWEYKTITFPADTTGVVTPNNGEGLRINWHLMAGSNYTGTDASTWGAYSSNRWAGSGVNNSVATTLNATWEITGVQYEVGDLATSFEHRNYTDELAKCQRYCYRIDVSAGFHFINTMAYNSSTVFGSIDLPVPMRARPTIMTPFGVAGDYAITSWGSQSTCTSLPVLNGSSNHSVQVQLASTGNVNTGYATMGSAYTSNNIYLIFDGGSEL